MSHALRGKSWEQTLEDMHALYNQSHRAAVTRNPAPMKLLAGAQLLTYELRGKRLTGRAYPAVFEAEGPPDYTAQSAGYSFLLDAKETVAERWDLALLKKHQCDAFDAHVRQRGHAFVLLHLARRMFLLPWLRGPDDDDLRGRWMQHAAGKAAHGWASLSAEQCLLLGAELRTVDWLPVALRMARERE